jgi:hypothetical protein
MLAYTACRPLGNQSYASDAESLTPDLVGRGLDDLVPSTSKEPVYRVLCLITGE